MRTFIGRGTRRGQTGKHSGREEETKSGQAGSGSWFLVIDAAVGTNCFIRTLTLEMHLAQKIPKMQFTIYIL